MSIRNSLNSLILLILIQTPSFANPEDSAWVLQNYTKIETMIPMRDGIKLYTCIYSPKDRQEKHPILITRTPYSCNPYGTDFRPMWNSHWLKYLKEGYIMVIQDVRGHFMSEGEFVDIRPFIEHKKGKKDIDEASDTYDTIDWLLKNTESNNGKVGCFGISYPGFYATMAALSGHPALKAVSPQAPVTDWFMGDDFHHNGALMVMDAFGFYSGFGKPHHAPYKLNTGGYDFKSDDAYDFYMKANTIDSLSKLMGDSIKFWKDLCSHPTYDDWWQARDPRNFVQYIPNSCATLVVGGLFDAEDCYGAWNLYKAIEKKTHNDNRLVIGPWAHGFWARDSGNHLGNICFGSATSLYYQDNFELPFFNYYLKGKGNLDNIKESNVFSTGDNNWTGYNKWADTTLLSPTHIKNSELYLQAFGKLSFQHPMTYGSFDYYLSDPNKPVPYTENINFHRTREYMTDDQRFVARRPDVLVYQTDVLTADMKVTGPVIADLFTSISTTDADFIVKIIDVFPDDFKYSDPSDVKRIKNYPMGGYQMMVRAEVMRGRYRNTCENPQPFFPEEITEVKYALPDISHVFKKGHRLMVQIQSSWFPLVDRNPQKFVNIYTAKPEDFVKSTITIHHDREHASKITIPIMQ